MGCAQILGALQDLHVDGKNKERTEAKTLQLCPGGVTHSGTVDRPLETSRTSRRHGS